MKENRKILSIYQRIKDIQRKFLGAEVDVQYLAECFLLSILAEEKKTKCFLDCWIKDPLLLFSVSQVIKDLQGKCYGIITTDGNISSLITKQSSKRAKLESRNVEQINYYLSMVEKKLEIGLDETISLFRDNFETIFTFISDKKESIDLLHVSEQCNYIINPKKITELLSDDAIIVVDQLETESAEKTFGFLNKDCIELFNCDKFLILQKTNGNDADPLQIKHLKRRLQTAYENIFITETAKVPSITVGVLAYNIGNYIQECLLSLISQQGRFRQDILVFEDCSTDNTIEEIEEFLQANEIPSNMSIQVHKNSKNIGLVKNYRELIKRANQINNDYFSILDGDDYLIDASRMQTHINYLSDHPEYAFSFNSMLTYYEKDKKFLLEEPWISLTKTRYSLFDLLKGNFIAASSVVRGNVVQHTPNELFDMYTADWFLHIYFSQYGDFGYINRPMSVYRKRPGSNWSSQTWLTNSRILFEATNDLNKLTNFEYDTFLSESQRNIYNQIYQEPYEEMDLLIIDDAFPHPSNGYRLQEYTSYLAHFDKIRIFATGVWTHLLGKLTNEEIVQQYKRQHPDLAHKIVLWKGYSFNFKISSKLAYICFLGNAYPCIDLLEKLNIPFVLELYPGGSFGLDNDRSDMMLERVLSSKCFRKVIVTQQATHDYLLKKELCSENEIVNIFGVVMPIADLVKELKGKVHFGYEKKTLDICFVAMKYTKFGSDKGYDLFIEVAKKLAKLHKNIQFHVVGGFDEKVIDVSSLKGRITFYGHQNLDWFDKFYSDKDIILSPTINGLTHNGAFDGFPTAACTDAGLRETAIFCTDPLNLNCGHYSPGKEIEIIDHDASYIVERVNFYFQNPDKLLNMAQKGRKRIQQLYSFDAQMKPRIKLLDDEISKYPNWVDTNIALASGDLRNMSRSNDKSIQSYGRSASLPANDFSQRKQTKNFYADSLFRKMIRFIKKLYKRLLVYHEVKIIRDSKLFDERCYLTRNSDVAESKVDPIYHYLVFGSAEGRDPAPWFSTNYYLAHNPDVKLANINPFLHYIKFGQSEGRETSNESSTY